MKRTLVLAAALASGIALSAAAQTLPAPSAAPEPAGPAKIAVIAFQAAVAKTNEGQRDFAVLKTKYAPQEEQLKKLSDEIDAQSKQLQAQSDKLSDAELASRSQSIEDKKKQLQRGSEDAQSAVNNEMQEIYNRVAAKVYDVMVAYVRQQGYTLVLDVSAQENPVLYANDSTNITQAVIDAYNTKSGVSAPPPDAPAAPAPKPAARPASTH
jgi:outer membrane protein